MQRHIHGTKNHENGAKTYYQPTRWSRTILDRLIPRLARQQVSPFIEFKDSGLRSSTRVGTLIVATIYLQLIQNRYMFRSFTVLQCSHQHCVQPVASDVEVGGYL